MRYPQYTSMVSAASQNAAIWRMLAVGMTTAVLFVAWIAAVALGISLSSGNELSLSLNRLLRADPTLPAGAAIYLLIVGSVGLATILAVRIWHKLSAWALTGPPVKTVRHFVFAALIALAVLGVVSVLPNGRDQEIVRNMDFDIWLLWLPVAVVALFAQTGAEEVLFRGYLQTHLFARFRSRFVWLFVPAVLFALAHFAPNLPSDAALAYFSYALVFGILAGDLTAKTGSIGAAWGFHFANNTIAVLFLSVEGSITGFGLFRTSVGLDDLGFQSVWFLGDLGVLLAIWWFIRRALD